MTTDLRPGLLEMLARPRPATPDPDHLVKLLSAARAGAYVGYAVAGARHGAEGATEPLAGRSAVLDAIGEAGDSGHLDCFVECLAKVAGQFLLNTVRGDWGQFRKICRGDVQRHRLPYSLYLLWWSEEDPQVSLAGRRAVLDGIIASGDPTQLLDLIDALAELAAGLLRHDAGGWEQAAEICQRMTGPGWSRLILGS